MIELSMEWQTNQKEKQGSQHILAKEIGKGGPFVTKKNDCLKFFKKRGLEETIFIQKLEW